MIIPRIITHILQLKLRQDLHSKTWVSEDEPWPNIPQPLPGAPKCGSYALSTTETPVIVEKLSSTENP